MDPRDIMMLLEDYNANPNKYSDQEAEMIAAMAASTGQYFRRESKPYRKLAFSLADTATLGLLPDSVFKPRSRGETVYGETMTDKIASGVGLAGGLIGGTAALAKGAMGAARYLGKPVMGVEGMTRGQQLAGQARDFAARSPLLHSMRFHAGRAGKAIGGTAAAQSTSRGFNKLVKNMSERLLITEDAARQILLGSGAIMGAGMYLEG